MECPTTLLNQTSALRPFCFAFRYGQYLDPFGQIWSVSNSTKDLHDVPPELARKIVPFVSVRDCAAYMTFLTTVFGAEVVYPPAKDPTGKVLSIRHIELFTSPLWYNTFRGWTTVICPPLFEGISVSQTNVRGRRVRVESGSVFCTVANSPMFRSQTIDSVYLKSTSKFFSVAVVERINIPYPMVSDRLVQSTEYEHELYRGRRDLRFGYLVEQIQSQLVCNMLYHTSIGCMCCIGSMLYVCII